MPASASDKHLKIKIISAGAGSGKTYRLTEEMVALLEKGLRPEGIIATTFTNLAATELRERVSERLLEKGLREAASRLPNALIGTVHGLGVKLLNRFAYEAGVPPEVNIMADEDRQYFFNQALATVLDPDRTDKMDALAERLSQTDPLQGQPSWRRTLKDLCDLARVNKLGPKELSLSKERSIEELLSFLGTPEEQSPEAWNEELKIRIEETVQKLQNNEDGTIKTKKAIDELLFFQSSLRIHGGLSWNQWAKLSKLKPAKKSEQEIMNLTAFAERHHRNRQLHEEIRAFISLMFELAADALREYEQFKKMRGLIDYNDMETLVYELLNDQGVASTLQEELDLLMVDEFQDTSPIQLAIFLKLSRFAKHVIWVGDPKQSIYGFRGAEPELMQSLLQQSGGLKPENILRHSWRSREEIVWVVNAHFTKAFPYLPPEQICLNPKRRRKASSESLNKADEPAAMQPAIQHWHFTMDAEKPKSGSAEWFDRALAQQLKTWLETEPRVLPKGMKKDYRPIKPAEVAILCRSNRRCLSLVEALHKVGLKGAVYRAGLLSTREVQLLLACVKYLINKRDALSIAEILFLASHAPLGEIVDSRLSFLYGEGEEQQSWASENSYIRVLDELRPEVTELSSSELLQLLQDRLDLRRVVVSWGDAEQRLANLEMLMKFALDYEDRCTRLHTAASVGGWLLWLSEQGRSGCDWQGMSQDENAIKVLTYHKSKGLEFSAVICYELESGLRNDGLWKVQVVAPEGELNPEHILSGRRLRYWVNPYGRQLGKTVLEQNLKESAVWAQEQQRSLREMTRLLYVGMTRARDYLIFPTRYKKPAVWLDLTFNQKEGGPAVLDPDVSETPWYVGDEVILKRNVLVAVPVFSV